MINYKLYFMFFLSVVSFNSFSKEILPAEIVGRDLAYPGLGWLGHVGITTSSMSSPSGMNQKAYEVIEVLNEPVVGQINSLANFKSRSKYWGSRWGVVNNAMKGYKVLVEANHQRWWCPVYTHSTAYTIGDGVPTTGAIFKCGVWRCDTFAWWAFYSAGYDTDPGKLMLPRVIFNAFKIPNISQYSSNNDISNSMETMELKRLEDMSTEELNNANSQMKCNFILRESLSNKILQVICKV